MDSDFAKTLRDENEALRVRVHELETALFARFPPPAEYCLTSSEARILGVLLARPVATKPAIMAALYHNQGRDAADQKIVDVLICKMRKKLKPFGIEILTDWGQGYYLADEVRHRLADEIKERAA